MKYLLDTHTWIWIHNNPQKLSPTVKQKLSSLSPKDELLLSAISPWEFSKLIEKGRLEINCAPEHWLKIALGMPKLKLLALTPQIAYSSTILPKPFHDDPADQIIVASARLQDAVLLSKDARINDYPFVNSLW